MWLKRRRPGNKAKGPAAGATAVKEPSAPKLTVTPAERQYGSQRVALGIMSVRSTPGAATLLVVAVRWW